MKPSETYDRFWLVSQNPAIINSRSSGVDFPYAGKWLLFIERGQIDAVWEQVKRATEAGLLGISSKCSTMRESPISVGKELVICVYTKDFRDKPDVFRVREELRKMGVVRKIPYKTNQATCAGQYSFGGKRVSLYYE